MIIYQGGTERLLSKENSRFWNCIAFHPDDDNFLFEFGGQTENNNILKTAFRIDLRDQTYTSLKDMPSVTKALACIGFKLYNGNPVNPCKCYLLIYYFSNTYYQF